MSAKIKEIENRLKTERNKFQIERLKIQLRALVRVQAARGKLWIN